jgi:uncharacterized membrane protein (DUF4010 family)
VRAIAVEPYTPTGGGEVDLNDAATLALGFGVALGAGLLIGVERERRKTEEPGVHGIRTFALVALAGAASEGIGGVPLLAVATAGVALLGAISHPRDAAARIGLTTDVALLVTVLIGGYAISAPAFAAALAVVVTILLTARDEIHRFVRETITDDELDDLLILAAAALVVLPLVPDRYLGPFGAVNPRTVWRIVVLIMAIQAVGYVAVRLLGPRIGLPLAGFASGFVSSTATIVAMGARAKTDPSQLGSASAGAILSTLATLAQAAVILATISPPTLARLAGPLLCAGTAAVIYGGIFTIVALREHASGGAARDDHAVNARVALAFAATLAVVLVASAALQAWFGRAGLVVAALVSGFADAHAPTASVASLVASGTIAAGDAVVPVLGAITTNTIVKTILAIASGGAPFALRIVPGLVFVVASAWGGVHLTP